MATYLTLKDLKTLVPEDVLRQLTDDNSTCAIDDVIAEEILQEACDTVDGYLRGRYTLPFADTPTQVTGFAKQLARYSFYDRRPEGFDLPDSVVRGRKNAMIELAKVRDGLVSLGVAETGGIVDDDGEFHVRVRSTSRRSKRAHSEFSKAVEQW